jgi:alanyl-tRNA synthetase
MVDDLRAKLGSGLVLLAATEDGRVSLALGVTKDLTGRFKAGDLVREIAAVVGGKGGGRPDFAQAGGSQPERIDDAFARLEALLQALAWRRAIRRAPSPRGAGSRAWSTSATWPSAAITRSASSR